MKLGSTRLKHNNQEVALVTRLMFKIVGKLLTCEQGIYFSRVRGNNHLFLPETRASLCGLKNRLAETQPTTKQKHSADFLTVFYIKHLLALIYN